MINLLQKNIIIFVSAWVREKKTIISQREIIKAMTGEGAKDFTVVYSLHSLVKKGYIRRIKMPNNQTFYSQLRGI